MAASIWLFPTSAAILTWHLVRPRSSEWRAAGATATAAALSASFTALPYVEFGVAAMPNLAAYGVAMILMGLAFSILNYYASARGLMPVHEKLTSWLGVPQQVAKKLRSATAIVMPPVPNGLRLSGARKGVRCSRGLGRWCIGSSLEQAPTERECYESNYAGKQPG